jgi:uncharacterized protein YciI
MYFVVHCTDQSDHLHVRVSTRPSHLTWIEANRTHIRIAGPLLAADQETPIGTLMIVECPDLQSAQELIAQDPYAVAGLFAATDIRPWRWTIGAPQGSV